MIGAPKMIMFAIPEIGEGDVDHFVMMPVENVGEAQLGRITAPVTFLEIPFAFFAPAEPGRTGRGDYRIGNVIDRDRIPIRLVRLR